MSFEHSNLDDEATLTREQRDLLTARAEKRRRVAEVRSLWNDADFEAESERLASEIAAFKITRCPPSGYHATPTPRRDASLI